MPRFHPTNVRRSRRWLALAVAVVLGGPAARAEEGKGSASFVALGPAGLRIEGSTDQVKLVAHDDELVVTVDLASLKTGIGVRDKHLREDLQTAQFPSAELRVKRAALKLPQPLAEASGEADGQLLLHGQSKPVHFRYTARRTGGGAEVTGALRIHLADFGIAPRAYLGISVKPDVDASVKLQVAP